MVGDGVAMQHLRTQLMRLGPHFRTVLLTGETGTGKELAARELHRFSPAADGPFVVFNAARVGEAVVEWQGSAESLPTATDDVEALLQAARSGTLYFDQIGEMPVAMQTQLLHVLQLRELMARGSIERKGERVQLIASTRQDLRVLASTGRFREDLYYRIATVEIRIPPLRKRMEDLPLLAQHFLRRGGELDYEGGSRMTGEALDRLMQYGWPGNVRELENLVRRCVVESGDGVIDLQHVAMSLDHAGVGAAAGLNSRPSKLQEVIEQHVLYVLKCCEGNKVRAAELLGISRSTLYRMLDSCAGSSAGVV